MSGGTWSFVVPCGWSDGREQWCTNRSCTCSCEQHGAELDDREVEAPEEPAMRVAKVPRGPSAKELASHLPSHEPYRTGFPSSVAGVSAINTYLRPRMRVRCL